jgi:hypothetical protein
MAAAPRGRPRAPPPRALLAAEQVLCASAFCLDPRWWGTIAAGGAGGAVAFAPVVRCPFPPSSGCSCSSSPPTDVPWPRAAVDPDLRPLLSCPAAAEQERGVRVAVVHVADSTGGAEAMRGGGRRGPAAHPERPPRRGGSLAPALLPCRGGGGAHMQRSRVGHLQMAMTVASVGQGAATARGGRCGGGDDDEAWHRVEGSSGGAVGVLLCSPKLVRMSKQAVGQRCAGAEGRCGGRLLIFLVTLASESVATTQSSHTATMATKSLSSLSLPSLDADELMVHGPAPRLCWRSPGIPWDLEEREADAFLACSCRTPAAGGKTTSVPGADGLSGQHVSSTVWTNNEMMSRSRLHTHHIRVVFHQKVKHKSNFASTIP